MDDVNELKITETVLDDALPHAHFEIGDAIDHVWTCICRSVLMRFGIDPAPDAFRTYVPEVTIKLVNFKNTDADHYRKNPVEQIAHYEENYITHPRAVECYEYGAVDYVCEEDTETDADGNELHHFRFTVRNIPELTQEAIQTTITALGTFLAEHGEVVDAFDHTYVAGQGSMDEIYITSDMIYGRSDRISNTVKFEDLGYGEIDLSHQIALAMILKTKYKLTRMFSDGHTVYLKTTRENKSMKLW